MGNEVGELMKARREIKVLKGSLEVVTDGYNRLEEENKRLKFMIDNGLGWDDMKGGNTENVS